MLSESKVNLSKRVAALTQTLDDLRTSMSMAGPLPLDWRLTPKESALFLALARNDVLTKKMALLVLYGTETNTPHSIGVFMSRLRHKTEPHGIKIETINRTGYRLLDRLVWVKALKLDASVAQ